MSFDLNKFKQTFTYKLFIIICLALVVDNVLYASDDLVVHNSEEMLTAITLEKKQVEKMVETMVKSGRLSPEEGEKARREIASIKESDIELIKNAAIKEFKHQSN